MPASILVVEDERAIQELIAINLEQSGQRAVRADSAEQALELIQTELPDLILLDWMLPGQSGLELARRLRGDARTKALPIIMLTARGEEADKLRGLETGADDYITKPFSLRELQARIKAVLRRRAPEITDDVIEYHGLKLDPASHRVTGRGKDLTMGPTEFRLLHFFLTHPERVYTRTQLLDHVWGDHVFIEERTVDVHIRRLRAALTKSGQQTFVQTIRGSGYRFSKA
ncbi:phosphate regulon transcriptional regulator PhoB [Usitatibacter palustris]|uniref:Phosphate regulon transcriptional regulatory protein PhoB n=1 Tax=Usitatibacter palustris TaxID=2732487 RepID=A0A6M4HDK7_9PROT|nr:phosphate regulon transcriptional regulator PhoB [Usitatibacter palustris]QJR16818.1 Phosphate regulon transcriptional regulatory protein PhoB [Usitatibacter palustris]